MLGKSKDGADLRSIHLIDFGVFGIGALEACKQGQSSFFVVTDGCGIDRLGKGRF